MPIGQFARITGLPARTLRFYADVEVFKPAVVDPATGYRYYHPGQIEVAHRVAQLRVLEVPLNEIRHYLTASGDEALAILERHRERLLARLERDRHNVILLETLLPGKEQTMAYEVKLRDVPATQALVVRAHVERPEDSGPEVVRAFTQDLWPHIRDHRYSLGAPHFFACHDLEGEGGPADLEMVVPVEGNVEGSGRIEVAQVPGGQFAYTLHEGGYDSMGAAYRAVIAWVEAQGLEIVGPSREVYLVDYQVTDDDDQLRTEVMYQVR